MNPLMDAIEDVLRLVAPSLVTVLLGAFFVQRFFVARANEASMIDFLIKELDELRTETLEYWTLPSDTKENKQRQTVLAQKIKGSIKGLFSDVGYFCHRYCSKKSTEMDKLLGEISDACTGGDFESANKKVDTGRYIIVINTINRVKSELLRRKL